ncbi:MAG TPA: cytochrome P460 family protein [Kofleriaceae bacterium]|nr:cytochrome P460 family protein [Kofleriaceae bacterium]
MRANSTRPALLAALLAGACGTARPAPVGIATTLTTKGLSNAELRGLVLASRSWPRLTSNALAKNELCAPAAPMMVTGSHPEHVGEMFHLFMPSNTDAFIQGKPMPDGAVIVKRSFKGAVESIDNGTTAYFIMYKRTGQNPTGGDWLYATTEPDGDVIRSGALADCAGCHNHQAASDYLFRKY